MDKTKIKELTGANMDIDLVSENIDWDQSVCPWNRTDNHQYNAPIAKADTET